MGGAFFGDTVMNSAQDALYQLHQLESEQFGYVPLPYDRFCARLLENPDVVGMLLPASLLNVRIQEKRPHGLKPVRLYIASDAAAAVPADEVRKAIERHAAGDWGLVGDLDWQANDDALRDGGQLLSIYESSGGQKFCVVTRADRMATAVLLMRQK